MSATLGDLLRETSTLLHSFTGAIEDRVTLTAPVDTAVLDLPVVPGGRVERGVIEIDDELLWVENADATAVHVPAFGRGFQGTTAATHAAGAMVTIDPLFPRKNIRDAILQTQASIFPQVFAVKTTTLTTGAAVNTYALPADTLRVIGLSYDSIGPSKSWPEVRRWDIENSANVTEYPTGKSLTIASALPPGRTMQVTYVGAFTPFATDADTLTGSGHQESHRDLLVYGACWRLLQFVEASRLQLNSVQNTAAASYSPAGAASAVTKQIYSLYSQRLNDEKLRLRSLYPTTMRLTR